MYDIIGLTHARMLEDVKHGGQACNLYRKGGCTVAWGVRMVCTGNVGNKFQTAQQCSLKVSNHVRMDHQWINPVQL